MNLILVRVSWLKSLCFLFFLFFNLQAWAIESIEGRALDCGERISDFANNVQSIDEAISAGIWKNTNGKIRNITEDERSNTSINAVGTIRCKKSNGEHFTATATITEKRKGSAPTILFAGHSTCDGDIRVNKNACVFQHEYRGKDKSRYGKVYEYKMKKRSTLYKCGDTSYTDDLAVATLEYFDGAYESMVILTNSIEKNRTVDANGNITYESNEPDKYSDAEMLLVGYDAIYKKIMVSENCGLFDKSEAASLYAESSEKETHDCKQTPGYSGGPIFKKKYNYQLKKYTYKLVCVNSGDRAYGYFSDPEYGQFVKGVTGGRCASIEAKSLQSLYRSIGAF